MPSIDCAVDEILSNKVNERPLVGRSPGDVDERRSMRRNSQLEGTVGGGGGRSTPLPAVLQSENQSLSGHS